MKKATKQKSGSKKKFVSIKVSQKLYEELVRAKGALMVEFGRSFTMEETLWRILSYVPRSKLKWEPVEEENVSGNTIRSFGGKNIRENRVRES